MRCIPFRNIFQHRRNDIPKCPCPEDRQPVNTDVCNAAKVTVGKYVQGWGKQLRVSLANVRFRMDGKVKHPKVPSNFLTNDHPIIRGASNRPKWVGWADIVINTTSRPSVIVYDWQEANVTMKISTLVTTCFGALLLPAQLSLSVGCSCGYVKYCNGANDTAGYCCHGVYRGILLPFSY
jgi:hypothetical protein